MKIALDYDNTFNVDPEFWQTVAFFAKMFGHEIRIVTYRDPIKDNIDNRVGSQLRNNVIYTDGIAKKFFCKWHADEKIGWDFDILIDDRPETAYENSSATQEILDKWRASEEYLK